MGIQKSTKRSSEEKKKILNRIHKLEGQMRGIAKMVEDDRYCDDILIQLSAVDKSIKSLANFILEDHMYSCVLKELEKGNEEMIDEVIQLFRRFQS